MLPLQIEPELAVLRHSQGRTTNPIRVLEVAFSHPIRRRMSQPAHAARTPKLRSQHITAVGLRVFAVEQIP